MSAVYNFSAGPAVLPKAVLEQAREELLDWHGSGMSVMEMSHRGKEFLSIAEQAEADLRGLLTIPDNYRVLFLQGGATSQFAMVPLNLLRGKQQADYINTGAWSKKAIAEAGRYCTVNVAASSEDTNFTSIPPENSWQLDADAAYVHYTPNETIGGVEFHHIPETGDVPLVADMSSTILSRPIDVSRYGIIYAGAQKNLGPAGLALVNPEALGATLHRRRRTRRNRRPWSIFQVFPRQPVSSYSRQSSGQRRYWPAGEKGGAVEVRGYRMQCQPDRYR